MPNQILETIAKDIQEVDGIIVEAKELISAAREAGENVKDMEAEMLKLEIRKERWKRMLSARGL